LAVFALRFFTDFEILDVFQRTGLLFKSVVLKVVDIDPQGSIGPSKGSNGGQWMARGSVKNCWGLLEIWSLQFKIVVNRARNANGLFQQIKQN